METRHGPWARMRGSLQGTEGAMVRSMCGVKLMDEKSTKGPMLMLDLNEKIDN